MVNHVRQNNDALITSVIPENPGHLNSLPFHISRAGFPTVPDISVGR